ncbi:adenylyl-sulfate kinase [Rhizobium leguminosarum bv. trifolii]|uniref:Adenylyl-sulfate kinase n=1 Tax=Rhizobium leguminosarum bv. trifolii TaxID=386 RepID=A0A3E1BLD4_RHILT|nr:AAA family ATPase [Rhizobium leguminosarum]RFB93456.1 adenylyl-sulfate kinase [Rhizobium leguminosarum bv. trifolii]RFB94304.1 adenylyl-sulfate kinase [Rhizobium leguminosarum bv. trifolii]
MLVIFGGLPGSGKTTISRALATRLGAVHVRVDTIEQAIRSSGDPSHDIGPAGYVVGYGVAEDNLTLGSVVIADSVNPLEITRDAWLAVAARSAVTAIEVEVICSDKIEHRRRAEARKTDVEGLVKPTWQQIVEHVYEDWGQRPIVVDTAAKNVQEIVDALIVRLGN